MPVHCPGGARTLPTRAVPIDIPTSWITYVEGIGVGHKIGTSDRESAVFRRLYARAKLDLAVRGVELGTQRWCGHYGCVSPVAGNAARVIKITGDPTDAVGLSIVAQAHGTRAKVPSALPQVQCVFAFTSSAPRLYGAILERLSPYKVSKATREFLDDKMFNAIWRYGVKKLPPADVQGLLEEAIEIGGDGFGRNVVAPLLQAARWLRDRGVILADVHSGNIMLRRNGEIVISDMGGLHSDATHPIPVLGDDDAEIAIAERMVSRAEGYGPALVETCPCGESEDPTVWLREDHEEIVGLINEVSAALRAKDLPKAHKRYKVLADELDMHFAQEEETVFDRLTALRHLDGEGVRKLATLKAQHPGFRRDITRVGRQPKLTGFAALAQALEVHATAENALLLPKGAGGLAERMAAEDLSPLQAAFSRWQSSDHTDRAAARELSNALKYDVWEMYHGGESPGVDHAFWDGELEDGIEAVEASANITLTAAQEQLVQRAIHKAQTAVDGGDDYIDNTDGDRAATLAQDLWAAGLAEYTIGALIVYAQRRLRAGVTEGPDEEALAEARWLENEDTREWAAENPGDEDEDGHWREKRIDTREWVAEPTEPAEPDEERPDPDEGWGAEGYASEMMERLATIASPYPFGGASTFLVLTWPMGGGLATRRPAASFLDANNYAQNSPVGARCEMWDPQGRLVAAWERPRGLSKVWADVEGRPEYAGASAAPAERLEGGEEGDGAHPPHTRPAPTGPRLGAALTALAPSVRRALRAADAVGSCTRSALAWAWALKREGFDGFVVTDGVWFPNKGLAARTGIGHDWVVIIDDGGEEVIVDDATGQFGARGRTADAVYTEPGGLVPAWRTPFADLTPALVHELGGLPVAQVDAAIRTQGGHAPVERLHSGGGG